MVCKKVIDFGCKWTLSNSVIYYNAVYAFVVRFYLDPLRIGRIFLSQSEKVGWLASIGVGGMRGGPGGTGLI